MTSSTRTKLYAAVALAAALGVVVALARSTSWRERRWDTLELALGDNVTTFDPALIKDVAGGRFAALLYPGLVKYGPDEKVAGDLAESWEVSRDALVYTFHLRRGALFSDGSPIASRDVVASFERALSAEVASPRSWVLSGIKGASAFREGKAARIEGLAADGDYTVKVTLERPLGTFLSLLTMPSASVLPAATPRKPFWGVDALPTAGGPFRIANLEPDVAVTLEANPRYFGPKPLLARIRYRIIRNPFAAVTEFRQGRLDVIEIPETFDAFFRGDPAWRPYIDSTEGLNVYYLGFNCTRPPFDGRDFRRAVCRALDRRAIVDGVLHGKAAPAAGPIPPGLAGFDPDFAGLAFDPSAAKAAIAAARVGRALEILVLSSPDTVGVAEAIAGQLRAAGLSVEVAPRERGTFKELLGKGDFDMVYYSWVADYADAENFLAPLFATSADRSTGNYTAYSSPAVDALLAGAAAEQDDALRAGVYKSVARMVVEDAPRAFLWHAMRVTVRQPWVAGFRLPHIYNAERFDGVHITRAEAKAK